MNKDKTSCSRPINLLSFPTIKCNKMRGRAGINVGNLKTYLAAMLLSACQSSVSFNVHTNTDIITFSETTDC